MMLTNGKGTDVNHEQAVNWFQQSAEQGNAIAQNNLAIMYALGKGTTKNEKLAYMWANLSYYNGGDGDEIVEILNHTMKFGDIRQAQKMTEECLEKNFRGCSQS
ncbi:sel1 repeat family protein [Shewanella submarina]|nr:sel1 repeat family protein [Shewanella submarina]